MLTKYWIYTTVFSDCAVPNIVRSDGVNVRDCCLVGRVSCWPFVGNVTAVFDLFIDFNSRGPIYCERYE